MEKYKKESEKLAEDPKWLLSRLKEARNCLVNDLRAKAEFWRFDHEKRRLVCLVPPYNWLQWKCRPKPDEPESYENQQTSVGTVVVEYPELTEEQNRRRRL